MQRSKRRPEEGNVFWSLRGRGERAAVCCRSLFPLFFFFFFFFGKKMTSDPAQKLSPERRKSNYIVKSDHVRHSEPFRMLLLRGDKKTGAQNDLAKLQIGRKVFVTFALASSEPSAAAGRRGEGSRPGGAPEALAGIQSLSNSASSSLTS